MNKMGGGTRIGFNYKVYHINSQDKFDKDLFKKLGVKDNLLYEVLYTGGAEFNQQKKEGHCLGKNLLSLIKGLKFFGDITIRGPVKIVGENQ